MSARKITVFDNVSADGRFADADGGLGWVVPSAEVTAAAMGAAPTVDTMLFGRKTYAMFEATWRDKDVDPHTGVATDASRQMSGWINDRAKIVFSRTLRDATWKNSRVLAEVDVETIRALKAERGGDMIVFGSGSIVSRLSDLGLVDEWTLVVNPVFLDRGPTLFDALRSPTKLTLAEQHGFPRTSHVLLKYRRA